MFSTALFFLFFVSSFLWLLHLHFFYISNWYVFLFLVLLCISSLSLLAASLFRNPSYSSHKSLPYIYDNIPNCLTYIIHFTIFHIPSTEFESIYPYIFFFLSLSLSSKLSFLIISTLLSLIPFFFPLSLFPFYVVSNLQVLIPHKSLTILHLNFSLLLHFSPIYVSFIPMSINYLV